MIFIDSMTIERALSFKLFSLVQANYLIRENNLKISILSEVSRSIKIIKSSLMQKTRTMKA